MVLAPRRLHLRRAGPSTQARPDAGPPVLTEKEPNDSAERALAIDRTSMVEANLGADPAHPDVDWYAFKSALPKTVDVTVTLPARSRHRPRAGRRDRHGAGRSQRGRRRRARSTCPTSTCSGRALARVVSLKRGAGGAYSLTARFSDRLPGYELEPDDRRVDATHVALGQAISGYLAHPNDVDCLPLRDARGSEPEPERCSIRGGSEGTRRQSGGAPRLERGGPPRQRRAHASGAGGDQSRREPGGGRGFRSPGDDRGGGGAVLGEVAGERLAVAPQRRRARDGSGRLRGGAVEPARHREGRQARLQRHLLATRSRWPRRKRGPAPSSSPTTIRPTPPSCRANSYREGFLSPRGDVDFYRLVIDGPSVATLQLSGVEKVDLALSVVTEPEGKPGETLLRGQRGRRHESPNSSTASPARALASSRSRRRPARSTASG